MSPGRRFYKMTGSGNDFVVFDSRDGSVQALADPLRIRQLCDRRQGIGADGVVLLEPSARADLLMTYFNSDGSRGAMCGNAALCVTRLASQLQMADPEGMSIETDEGITPAPRLVRRLGRRIGEKRWDRVLDQSRPPFARWFTGGVLMVDVARAPMGPREGAAGS